MMRGLEIVAFIALSGALHAATLVMAPLQGGASNGGDNGLADITLQAATPTLAAMVQDWDRVPEISDAPVLTPPTGTKMPDRPTANLPPVRTSQTPSMTDPSPAPDLPQAETRLPAPLVPLAQTATDMPPPPDQRLPAAPELPNRQNGPRPDAPSQLAQVKPTDTSPDVDTAPPITGTAPTASLRPALRTDRPIRRAAPAPKAAQPKQSAKGSGTRQTATAPSQRAAPVASGPSKAKLSQLEQQWGARITSALRRAHRPPRGARGTVKLVISITPGGQIAGVSLAASSGNSRLDQAALSAVQRARFPRAPKGLTNATYRFSQRLTVAR